MLDTRPNGRLDGTLDPADPEALLYERRNDGTLKLTGVEYIVAGGARPALRQDFADTNLARFGNPDANVWTLHAWVWKPNPDGMFDPWNDAREPAESTILHGGAPDKGEDVRRAPRSCRQRAAVGRSSCPKAARSTNSPTPGSATSSPPSTSTLPRSSTISGDPVTSVPS